MAGTITNPRIWLGADVYVAPVGTAAPNDLTAPWASPWVDVGFLSEDGVTEERDEDLEDHFAWGGLLIRQTRANFKRSMKIIVLEDNKTIYGLINPGSTHTTDGGGITTRTVSNPAALDRRAFGMEMRDGTNIVRRVIPSGGIREVGEVTFSESEMSTRELTLSIFPSASGVLYVDMTNDPQASVTVVLAVPVVSSFSPVTGPTAGGTLVRILGSGFIGTLATSGVKFGAVNATSWIVENDSEIVALSPAGTAGGKIVTVTNATGASISTATFLYV